MGDGDAVGRPGIELRVAEIDCVRRDGARCRKTCRDQAGERPVMAAAPHGGDLRLVLRDMDEDLGAGLLGAARALLQQRVGAGVEGVRRDAGEDTTARIGAVALEDRIRRLPVRRRPGIDQRMADHGAG